MKAYIKSTFAAVILLCATTHRPALGATLRGAASASHAPQRRSRQLSVVDAIKGASAGILYTGCESMQGFNGLMAHVGLDSPSLEESTAVCMEAMANACQREDLGTNCNAAIACFLTQAGATDPCTEAAFHAGKHLYDFMRAGPFALASLTNLKAQYEAVQCLRESNVKCAQHYAEIEGPEQLPRYFAENGGGPASGPATNCCFDEGKGERLPAGCDPKLIAHVGCNIRPTLPTDATKACPASGCRHHESVRGHVAALAAKALAKAAAKTAVDHVMHNENVRGWAKAKWDAYLHGEQAKHAKDTATSAWEKFKQTESYKRLHPDPTPAPTPAPPSLPTCTFQRPGSRHNTAPHWFASKAKYNDVHASCKDWFYAGDNVFDVQAAGPTADFCGCCAACDPFGHGHGYSTCLECADRKPTTTPATPPTPATPKPTPPPPKMEGVVAEGCYLNFDGPTRLDAYTSAASHGGCLAQAAREGKPFAALEYREGPGEPAHPRCLVLDALPAQAKVADVNCWHADAAGNSLGATGRLAVYRLPAKTCTFQRAGSRHNTAPAWFASRPQYDGLHESCKAWLFAGDFVYDVQADGPTEDFCGCCDACQPQQRGHGYGVCNVCPKY